MRVEGGRLLEAGQLASLCPSIPQHPGFQEKALTWTREGKKPLCNGRDVGCGLLHPEVDAETRQPTSFPSLEENQLQLCQSKEKTAQRECFTSQVKAPEGSLAARATKPNHKD